MKFRRILYLVLGIIFVLFNALIDFGFYLTNTSPRRSEILYQIVWYTLLHLFFTLGGILFYAAYRLEKKIKSEALIQEFLKDEIQQNSVR